uniref:GRANULINS domain-containing protein n=1 Tax=Heligmosomoides polygyrus TaxID=6339 RepID=A0A183GPF5_HELPZ
LPPTGRRKPNPLCDGREASAGYCQAAGVCPVGFTCTTSNVCCRCLYGTSIGPCVNSKCPDNYQCNINNECCPYQVGK